MPNGGYNPVPPWCSLTYQPFNHGSDALTKAHRWTRTVITYSSGCFPNAKPIMGSKVFHKARGKGQCPLISKGAASFIGQGAGAGTSLCFLAGTYSEKLPSRVPTPSMVLRPPHQPEIRSGLDECKHYIGLKQLVEVTKLTSTGCWGRA